MNADYIHNCSVCYEERFRSFDRKLKLVTCIECGLVFVNPQPDDSELSDIYSHGYYDDRYPDWKDETVRHQKRLGGIEGLIGKGKLLDIGSGKGHFLALARENGWKTCGIEISHEGVRYARNRFGLDVFEGVIEDVDFPEASFDAICLWDVLEHMKTPRSSLNIIYDLLREGGILAITMPNGDSLSAMIDGPKWQYYDFKRYKHLWHFGTKSLQHLLSSVGFRGICIRTRGSGLPKTWRMGGSAAMSVIARGWSGFNYVLRKGDLLSGYALK